MKKRFTIVLVLLLVGGAITAYSLNVPIPGLRPTVGQTRAEKSAKYKVELAKDKDHTLVIPAEVRKSLGIRKGGEDLVATAESPVLKRPLVLSASTMFDPSKLFRIKNRFAGAQVLRIEPKKIYPKEGTQERKLQVGDEVTEGTPLAVIYSVDVGNKKNDLIDALVNYKFDNDTYTRAKESTALPQVQLDMLRKNVQGDLNTINRSIESLKYYDISDDDIKEVEQEADAIIKKEGRRDPERKKRDPKEINPWGKVILRAPATGIIVEQNVTEKEFINDTTVNLYQIANSDSLLVAANCPEEEVKELIELKKSLYELRLPEMQWTLRPLGAPNSDGIVGPIEEIAQLVDPNTHTVPIKGRIPNKDGILRATQYMMATIELPAPKDVVEIPAAAVADDGKQAVVFVQTDAAKGEYTLRRVMITHRFENRVFVRSELSETEKKLTPEESDAGLMHKQPLRKGERVLKSGLLELKKELEDLESAKSE